MANDKKQKLQTITQRIGRFIARTSIPEVMLIAIVCLSRYLQNSDFSYPSEIITNIVLLGIIVSAAFYVYRLVLGVLGAHVAALLLSYALYAFSYAFAGLRDLGDVLIPHGVTPFTFDALQMLWLTIVFGAVGFAAQKISELKQLKDVPILKFLVFVICVVFVMQLGKVGLRLWEIRKDLTYTQPTTSFEQQKAATQKPNIYYLVFDRYASAETLKNTYNYDNNDFVGSLSQRGLTVRENAYSNYPFTTQSISSTLAADYHANLAKSFKNSAVGFQTAFPYRQILDKSPVTEAFKKNGYQYNQVSSWWDFTRVGTSADQDLTKSFRLRIFGKNFWMTDLQRDIINKSILGPLLRKGITAGDKPVITYRLDRNPKQNFVAEMQTLKTLAANSSKQSQPQFTFAHILSPHDPYIFDAAGNEPDYDGNRTDNGADERVKYTNQLTYVNTQIEDLITTIRSKDPTAAIIMQTDEGPYPKQFRGTLSAKHYYDPKNLPVEQQRQKFGILAAYYLPGITQPVDSSVNSFRIVLNNYLGYSLPLLPDCQFTSGNKFSLYDFTLVSGALKGTAQPAACNAYK